MVLRFTGQIPGRKSVGLVRGYGGSLALTNQRVLGTMSVLPGKDGRAIDQPGLAAGTVRHVSESGLLLEIAGRSEFWAFSLTYKAELAPDVLARVPSRTLAFDVPPKFVYSVLGIPRG